ncbi:unnamed protein product [Rodentolepis nana]|uniref:Calmodulin-lysine N-methyltransferase n=1 Tax=Rodentolepis nana TaxID=102285 RepID=A0A0R3T2X0_RODNA|nr:unnamed protein product [Rodentolepis nana]
MSKKSDASLKRWSLIRNYILNPTKLSAKPCDYLYSANIFGLFEVIQVIESPSAVTWRLTPQVAPGSCKYLTLAIPKTPIEVQSRVEDLVGFDRTGIAVILWPCELLLAYFFMLPPGRIQNVLQLPVPCKRVIELAAGGLGIGGIALASVFPDLNYIALTDGNEKCVQNLENVIKEGNYIFHSKLESALLRWSNDIEKEPSIPKDHNDWRNSFDLVFTADCFFNQSHGGLLRCIDFLLSKNSGSTFLAFAPLRSNTLKSFVESASSEEVCERFQWSLKFLRPEEVFPELSGDEEKMVPHMVYIQRC